ncbi:response regulator transcription factor [Novosphingobium album (ex Liu et al. 2023)]|uniref:Response regulator transcription factor n=1 Tax=Novosphingobium album (ex Liu et al. 2023) TaxID=3031130 RepID=A0ABT5WMT3_9SPHN|nr:response regulator transcription factor [Novosphingobium album (ex Liu et al. 2023)]MDE8651347.1 response regulator transcription factor [Novosphingobium album (ex Liu et al. 2023)]
MERFRTLSLIDPDTRRRAETTMSFAQGRFHVEPYESPAEFFADWPFDSVLLVADNDDCIASVLEGLRARGAWLPIIGFSDVVDPLRSARVMFDGLVAYIPAPVSRDLVDAFLSSTAQELAALTRRKNRAAAARARLSGLTRREAEVLSGVAEGLTNKAIADRLGISHRTIEIHRANLLRKLDTNSSYQAMRAAIEADLLS